MRDEVSPQSVLRLCSGFGIGLKDAFDLVYKGGLAAEITENAVLEESSSRIVDLYDKITSEGFTPEVVEEISQISKEIYYGTTVLERIPQRVRSGLAKGSLALCAAEAVCAGCPATESESREIYDTDDLREDGLIQTSLVEGWARKAGYWMENVEDYLAGLSELTDAGTECVVYFCPSEGVVYKTMSLKYYNVLRPALDRIVIHNALFPDTAITVIGFGHLKSGKFAIIVCQPYVRGGKPTQKQRHAHMLALGFRDAGMDYGMQLNYISDELYVGDVNEFNAILTEGGVSVIDADCRIVRPGLLGV